MRSKISDVTARRRGWEAMEQVWTGQGDNHRPTAELKEKHEFGGLSN
jgi:hypothetical protein